MGQNLFWEIKVLEYILSLEIFFMLFLVIF